ncbi:hypothetical protein CDAR_226951 [Caerostris darwini]|uniref:Uncharacterized protein n=1 Tax=Caerostris darwini TaxID=1538125 RepID=A0AAV4VVV4_9ARAC|nr:hypothetical protein CDAR_226951 [Caerostris darwini]
MSCKTTETTKTSKKKDKAGIRQQRHQKVTDNDVMKDDKNISGDDNDKNDRNGMAIQMSETVMMIKITKAMLVIKITEKSKIANDHGSRTTTLSITSNFFLF